MSVGALAGFAVVLQTGNYALGLLTAALSAALLSSVHAFVCVRLRSNQTVSGLALVMLGMGASSLFGRERDGFRVHRHDVPR